MRILSSTVLSLFAVILISSISFALDISTCTNLNSANTVYDLTANVNSTATCMNISANNVTLDCHGFTINYSTSATGYGINNQNGYHNSTIRNCVIVQGSTSSYSYSIYHLDSYYNKIFNNSILTYGSFSSGIWLEGDMDYTKNSNISNNSIETSGYYASAISLFWDDTNTIVFNSLKTTGSSASGIDIDRTSYVMIYNNLINASKTPIMIYSASYLSFNTSNQTGTRIYSNGNRIGGNYYTNSTGNGFSDTCNDTDNDGFCDSYYDVNSRSACSAGTCGNNVDYLALSNNYSVPYGFMGVSLSCPISGSNNNINQNSTFRINATVNCSSDDPDATCGTVSGTARYNFSSINPDANLNTTDGHKPFFTLSGNPQSCGSMSYGDSCNLSWLVNATGDIGSQWAVDVLFESSEAGVDENQTDDANVTITGCSIDVTLDFIAVLFSNETYQPYPNTYGNEAINNSLSFYNITVNPGSCILDIYTKATDMASDSTGYSIGAANLTFSSTAYDYASSTRYSNAYQMLKSSVNPGTEFINWFWLDIPPILAGTYNGSIYIASVNEGESP